MLLQRRFVSLVVFFLIIFNPLQRAKAEASREFLLSCTYGVLAGALVGAATLAVEDDPSSKVYRVARGASLGLYAGILLGLYVVYVVPAQIEAEENKELKEEYEEAIDADDYGLYKVRPRVRLQQQVRIIEPPKLMLYPVMENNRITGAAINYSIVRF